MSRAGKDLRLEDRKLGQMREGGRMECQMYVNEERGASGDVLGGTEEKVS